MRINIRVDAGRFDREADEYIEKVVRPAQAVGLNKAAQLITVRLEEATRTSFDRPKTFTQKGFAFLKASPRKGREINANIRVKSKQAQYLDLQIWGGFRRAGDHATTKKGPLVAGKGAKLNKYGGLPRGWTARQAAREDTFWEDCKGMPVLLQRTKRGGVKVLAIIVREVKLPARFDFYDIVQSSAKKHVAREIQS